MRRQLAYFILITGILITFGTGCQPTSKVDGAEGEDRIPLTVSSSAFIDGGDIPIQYTCDGENLLPPLSWSGVPEDALSLAIIADDPDAPVGTFVHWVLYDLPPDVNLIAEAKAGEGTQGVNSFGEMGYRGPCPPKGSTHRYFFKLYALDTPLNLDSGATKDDVEGSMKGHILVQGELMGRYGR
jgi:Raf kinase inhibitor-like YbhB/YbcL family protein